MKNLSLSSKIRLKKEVLFRELDGETVLLNTQTGVYFGLDPAGTAVWNWLQKERQLKPVFESMLETYDVDAAQCKEDLLRFAQILQKNGLLEVNAG